jgi:ATP-binding cassette subfamily B protein
MKESDTLRQKVKHALRLDRAVRFVWEAGPGWTIASLALVFLQGVLPLLALYVMKLIVDAVTFALTAPDKTAAFRQVVLFIGFAIGIALLNALCQMITGLVKEAQALEVSDYIYNILHSKSIEVDLEYYENPQYYDTFHRAQ